MWFSTAAINPIEKKKSNEVFKLRYGYLGNINIMTYYEVMLKIIVKIKQWKTLNENININ